MTKRTRQYLGLLSAIIAYYLIHEGAHFLYAAATGVFKQINFMGLGMQIDIYADRLSPTQLGFFCLVGAIATQVSAYIMVLMSNRICRSPFKLPKAICYYVTIALLLLDPIYLSLLCGFFGGGDMNGIAYLIPEPLARIGFGILLFLNAAVFWKVILPRYQRSFSN